MDGRMGSVFITAAAHCSFEVSFGLVLITVSCADKKAGKAAKTNMASIVDLFIKNGLVRFAKLAIAFLLRDPYRLLMGYLANAWQDFDILITK